MKRINVGADISKSKIDICIMNKTYKDSAYFTIENGSSGFQMFLEQMEDLKRVPYVGFESTASYGKAFQQFLSANGIPHKMFNPRYVRNFSKAVNMQGKTDEKDSFLIAKYVHYQEDKEFGVAFDEDADRINKINISIKMLTKMQTQLANLVESINQGMEVEELTSLVKRLREKIQEEKEQLEELGIKHLKEAYPMVVQIENQIKGVGYKLLLPLIPQIYASVGSFSKKQIIAYLGLNPVPFQSGNMSLPSRMNIYGDPHIKSKLFMSAITAIQHNEILKMKYKEMTIIHGKAKKVAIAAVMRKLVLAIISKIEKYKRLL